MKSTDVRSGYIGCIGDDRKRFATWTSEALGKVTSYTVEPRDRYTPSGGQYRMRRVLVRTPDGSTWRGRCSIATDAITIRRISPHMTCDDKGPKDLRAPIKPHAAPFEIPFPTIEMAREYAEDWHEYPDGNRRKKILFNIVGDQDTIVRWSSYGVSIGHELAAGAYA
ncbi:hypothetical protein [Streptomyces aureocirculatus]|uniref:hypothetical protein n=1 Tax=Streptomyces aureocirculatus TaxID=67275 RepID=UPI0004CC5ACF|nr:hypothetical protein [Streptomyces aureocirculatus]